MDQVNETISSSESASHASLRRSSRTRTPCIRFSPTVTRKRTSRPFHSHSKKQRKKVCQKLNSSRPKRVNKDLDPQLVPEPKRQKLMIRIPISIWQASLLSLNESESSDDDEIEQLTIKQTTAIFRLHSKISTISVDRCPNCYDVWIGMNSSVCERCHDNPELCGVDSNPSTLPQLISLALSRPLSQLFHEVLTAFQISTLAERNLIARVTLFMYIFKKRNAPGAGEFFRGSFLAFPEGHPALEPVMKLPRTVVPFITIRTHSEMTNNYKEFRVRRQIISIMLEWLVHHSSNPMYANQSDLIDGKRLSELPDEGYIETAESAVEVHDVLILQNFQAESIDSDLRASVENQNSLLMLETPLPNPPISVQLPRMHGPLPYWSPMIFLGAFPLLFLSVDGLPVFEAPAGSSVECQYYPARTTCVLFKTQVQHLLKLAYSSPLTGTLIFPFQNPSFVAVCRQITMAQAVRRNSRFFLRKNKLTDITIPELLANLDQRQDLVQNCVSFSTSSFSGSTSYWQARRRELWEISRQYPTLNCFYTITMAELHHPVLLELLGSSADAPLQQRIDALAQAPGLVDAFFYDLSRLIVTDFLRKMGLDLDYTRIEYQVRGQPHAHGIGDFPPFRLDSQLQDIVVGHLARLLLSGSPLNGLTLPTEIITQLQRVSSQELISMSEKSIQAEKEVCDRIIQYVSARNPLFERAFKRLVERFSNEHTSFSDHLPVIPDPCYLSEMEALRKSHAEALHAQGECDPITIAIRSMMQNGSMNEAIRILVERCMIHRCNAEYCRAVNPGRCRFGHPRPLYQKPFLKVEFDESGNPRISLTMASNDPWLHPYSAAFLAATACRK